MQWSKRHLHDPRHLDTRHIDDDVYVYDGTGGPLVDDRPWFATRWHRASRRTRPCGTCGIRVPAWWALDDKRWLPEQPCPRCAWDMIPKVASYNVFTETCASCNRKTWVHMKHDDGMCQLCNGRRHAKPIAMPQVETSARKPNPPCHVCGGESIAIVQYEIDEAMSRFAYVPTERFAGGVLGTDGVFVTSRHKHSAERIIVRPDPTKHVGIWPACAEHCLNFTGFKIHLVHTFEE